MANRLFLHSGEAKRIFLGPNEVKNIYRGPDLIWNAEQAYYMTGNGTNVTLATSPTSGKDWDWSFATAYNEDRVIYSFPIQYDDKTLSAFEWATSSLSGYAYVHLNYTKSGVNYKAYSAISQKTECDSLSVYISSSAGEHSSGHGYWYLRIKVYYS